VFTERDACRPRQQNHTVERGDDRQSQMHYTRSVVCICPDGHA
jgi:hypothetical protein